MDTTQLSTLRKLAEYRQTRTHVFPSDSALQWFVRQNRDALVEAGALVMLTGQWHAVEPKFDAFVLEAGKRAAQRHSEAA